MVSQPPAHALKSQAECWDERKEGVDSRAKGGFQSAHSSTSESPVLGGSGAESMLISGFNSPEGSKSPPLMLYHIPLGYTQGNMAAVDKEKQKLIARIKRIRGQVDSIERSLTTGDNCADILMLLANVRGGVNSLMAEVLEDHIRLHLLTPEKNSAPPHELAEDLIDLVRAYLK